MDRYPGAPLIMKKRKFKLIAGILLSGVLVFLLFRKADWGQIRAAVSSVDPAWLITSQVFLWLAIFFRTFRWGVIVRTGNAASFRALFSATQIGLFANLALPGRLGELIRALLIGRLASMPLALAVAFVLGDRLTDLAGLAAVLLVCICGYRPPPVITLPEELSGLAIPADIIVKSAYVSGGAFLAGVLAVVMLRQRWERLARLWEKAVARLWPRLSARSGSLFEQFGMGLDVFRQPGRLVRAVLFSWAVWGAYVAGVACILRAFHLNFPWYTPFAVQAFAAAAISLPAAPGFVGQFHLGVVLGLVLTMPGIPYASVQAAALLMHVLFLTPVILSGVIGVVMEHQALFSVLSKVPKNGGVGDAAD